MLGTFGPTSPGIPIGAFVIPLTWDQYFCESFVYPNTGPFEWNLGSLNFEGKGLAPSGLTWGPEMSVFAGTQAHHALVVWNPATGDVYHVSAPTSMTFTF